MFLCLLPISISYQFTDLLLQLFSVRGRCTEISASTPIYPSYLLPSHPPPSPLRLCSRPSVIYLQVQRSPHNLLTSLLITSSHLYISTRLRDPRLPWAFSEASITSGISRMEDFPYHPTSVSATLPHLVFYFNDFSSVSSHYRISWLASLLTWKLFPSSLLLSFRHFFPIHPFGLNPAVYFPF